LLALNIKNSMEEYEGRIGFNKNPDIDEEVLYDKF
jgi:hypothetical protein